MAALDGPCDLVAPALLSARWTSTERGIDGRHAVPPGDQSSDVLSPGATVEASPPELSPPAPIRANLPLRI
jgi:hypothetical protein